jgi:hypothetical protein
MAETDDCLYQGNKSSKPADPLCSVSCGFQPPIRNYFFFFCKVFPHRIKLEKAFFRGKWCVAELTGNSSMIKVVGSAPL